MRIGRFAGAALAAGVVLNAGGISLAHLLLAEHVERLMEKLGGFPAWAPFAHLSIRLAMGAVSLWILIRVRPAFLDTMRAIAATAAACWLLAYPIPLEMWHVHAGMGPGTLAALAVWGYFELCAGLAVGWIVYRGRARERATGARPA